jgi:hypothetical protein
MADCESDSALNTLAYMVKAGCVSNITMRLKKLLCDHFYGKEVNPKDLLNAFAEEFEVLSQKVSTKTVIAEAYKSENERLRSENEALIK